MIGIRGGNVCVPAPGGGSGSGESNTSSNDGTGAGLAKPKTGVNLPFKSLKAGSNITLTENANDVEIAASGGGGGEANTSSNTGGGVGLARPKAGVDLPFKSLIAGTGITLVPFVDAVEIQAATGGGWTCVNIINITNDSLITFDPVYINRYECHVSFPGDLGEYINLQFVDEATGALTNKHNYQYTNYRSTGPTFTKTHYGNSAHNHVEMVHIQLPNSQTGLGTFTVSKQRPYVAQAGFLVTYDFSFPAVDQITSCKGCGSYIESDPTPDVNSLRIFDPTMFSSLEGKIYHFVLNAGLL